MIALARRVAWSGFVFGAVLVGGLGLVARAAPLAGHDLYAVRTGSMAPAVGVGALAVVRHADPVEDVGPPVGDVIAYQLPSGTTVIHRVLGGGAAFVVTKGDANPAPDPGPVPASAVIGSVVVVVPVLGYLLAMLSMPSGVVAIMAILGTLLATAWMLEEPGPATRHRPGTAPIRTRSG